MSVVGKVVTAPAPRKGFGELFGEAKGKLDNLQKDMASIFPAMPGQNVAKYYDLAIGIDFHETIFPPMPLLPVPHIGMVFDIMSAVMSAIASVVPPPPLPPADGSSPPTSLSGICKAIVHSMKPTVQVHGQWVANAGTGIQHLPGIFVHIPFPIVKPMASSEMWMGSSTVLADGEPCSTQFHPALSCNLVGLPSPPRITKPKPKVALMAPTSMLLIITSGGAPVLVGGRPTIDLFQLAIQLGLKGMGKLWGKGKKFLKKAPDEAPNMKAPKANKSKFVGENLDAPKKPKIKDDVIDLTPGSKGGWNKKLNGELQPNSKYKVGNKIYETDDLGRVSRVSGDLELGKLGRNNYQQGKSVTLKDGTKGIDQGGHLVGHQFKGAGEQINYVPMKGSLNQGAWKQMEESWAKALKEVPPKAVDVDIRPLYDGISKRPTKFKVVYKIDGKKYVKTFPNN